jgi:hypothetical protein
LILFFTFYREELRFKFNGSGALAPPKENEAKATVPKFGSGALAPL